jgi:hypothetical protein
MHRLTQASSDKILGHDFACVLNESMHSVSRLEHNKGERTISPDFALFLMSAASLLQSCQIYTRPFYSSLSLSDFKSNCYPSSIKYFLACYIIVNSCTAVSTALSGCEKATIKCKVAKFGEEINSRTKTPRTPSRVTRRVATAGGSNFLMLYVITARATKSVMYKKLIY